MATKYTLFYAIAQGKRKTDEFVPVLQELAATSGKTKMLVRDSDGEVKEQNIEGGGGGGEGGISPFVGISYQPDPIDSAWRVYWDAAAALNVKWTYTGENDRTLRIRNVENGMKGTLVMNITEDNDFNLGLEIFIDGEAVPSNIYYGWGTLEGLNEGMYVFCWQWDGDRLTWNIAQYIQPD